MNKKLRNKRMFRTWLVTTIVIGTILGILQFLGLPLVINFFDVDGRIIFGISRWWDILGGLYPVILIDGYSKKDTRKELEELYIIVFAAVVCMSIFFGVPITVAIAITISFGVVAIHNILKIPVKNIGITVIRWIYPPDEE